jgi:hypothetical protein
MSGYLTLAGHKSLSAPISSLRDNHRLNTSSVSAIPCDYSAITYFAFAAIKLFHNAHGGYNFFGSPNTEEDAV